MNSALHQLHNVGWVHGGPTPGNIIVVGTTAKISDFEFAKRREVYRLEELTKPPAGGSSHVAQDVRTVGLPSASFRSQTDPDQGALHFVAVEVEAGRYMFRPEVPLNLEGGEYTTRSAAGPPERTFLHNPLHDYESIWWIAVWFVFRSKPEGVADGVMELARDQVYKSRDITFTVMGTFWDICKSLPAVLQPLGNVLAMMRDLLVAAYRSFEDSFDGSKMLLVFQGLKQCLLLLEKEAQGLAVKPRSNLRLNTGVVEQLDEISHQEKRPQAVEHEGRVGGPSTDAENPSISTQPAHSVLGKRASDEGPPRADEGTVKKFKVNQL